VAPDSPVIILATIHTRIVNSCALRLANVTKDSKNPVGGIIHKNPENGEPTGELSECRTLIPISEYDFTETKNTIKKGIFDYWVKNGFTSVYSFSNRQEIKIFQQLQQERSLPLRIQMVLYDGENRLDLFESALKLGLSQGFGNDWLKFGGIKLTLDGAFMGMSAATYEPYQNVPQKDNCGIIKLENQQALKDLMLRIHDEGFQLLIHAFGDKAQDLILDGYDYILEKSPRSHRHRIEHFGNVMTNQDRINRAKRLDIIPVTTIQWLYSFADFIEPHLGPKRAEQSFVLRSMLDAGLKVCDCSDTFGAEPLSTNPFFNIWCAVNRQTYFEKTFLNEQAISVKEAIRLYTVNAAWAGFDEELKGSIEKGKLADFIVIDKDIFTIPQMQIKDINVDMTIIDDKIVYQR
jgi:predicted amidohydrolase YtcJ